MEHDRVKIAASPCYRRRLVLPVVAAVITIAIFTPFARLGADAHHDGIMLNTALDLASGQALFRDTFTNTTPSWSRSSPTGAIRRRSSSSSAI
jgi:hypothetical protein